MKSTFKRRALVLLALGYALMPALGVLGQSREEPKINKTQQLKITAGKLQHLKGKVVFLDSLLQKIGSRLDPESSPHWMALVTDKGEIYPLIRDAGSKMFFTDAKTRDRPMRLTGRLIADTHLLQVLDIRSFQKGKLHEIYYWCDICQIRRTAGGICECCGGPMHLRERPAGK